MNLDNLLTLLKTRLEILDSLLLGYRYFYLYVSTNFEHLGQL